MTQKNKLKKIVANNVHRLRRSREQEAKYGISTPPEMSNEIGMEDNDIKFEQLQAESEATNSNSQQDATQDRAHQTAQSIPDAYRLVNSLFLSLNVGVALLFILIKYSVFADAIIAAVVVIVSLMTYLFPIIKNTHKSSWFSTKLTSVGLIVLLIILGSATAFLMLNTTPDLRISRIDNQDEKECGIRCTITIEGQHIDELEPGDRLSVYGSQARLIGGTWSEVPIAVLGVVQVDRETTAIAQLLLIHEDSLNDASKQIRPGQRVTKITNLDQSYLLPAFGDGYLLEEGVVHLQPNLTVQEGDTLVVLEAQLQGDRILDHLATDTRFQVLKLGEEGIVIQVKLFSGLMPAKGTLVQLQHRSGLYVEPDMVFVSKDTFEMGNEQGDEDEAPVGHVAIEDFYISKTEITNAQYAFFIKDGGYDNPIFWTRQGYNWLKDNNKSAPKYWNNNVHNQPSQPVVGVSWHEALAFANWLSKETGATYRLPSEAEWELACRGTTRVYPWGDSWDGALANFADRSYADVFDHYWADTRVDDGYTYSAPVGSYLLGSTPSGLLDMAGNVWEWTSSLYFPYPYSMNDERENLDSDGKRVTRGGGWGSRADQLRCTNRKEERSYFTSYNLGFRLVRIP